MSATMQVDIRVAVCIMQPRFVRLCFGQVVTTTIDISQDRADRAVTPPVHLLHTHHAIIHHASIFHTHAFGVSIHPLCALTLSAG